jgi:hypothetical protein
MLILQSVAWRPDARDIFGILPFHATPQARFQLANRATVAASLIMLALLSLLAGLASVDALAGRTPGSNPSSARSGHCGRRIAVLSRHRPGID